MQSFKGWTELYEALVSYIQTGLYIEIGRRTINEGRKNPSQLRTAQVIAPPRRLFGDEEREDPYQRPDFKGCPVTPLSSYDKEIKTIQDFAIGPKSNPDTFAQVMMFSPLSANVSFAKHWDNFPVLMTILHNLFPKKIPNPEALQQAIFAFNEKYSSLGATVAGWKFDTITHIWNNREALYNQIRQAAATGDDINLITALTKIPGAGPVKAGFMAQLIFGRSGCLDTHNIDIYSKVFPDLKNDLNPADWDRSEEGIQKYVDTLNKLKQRGIGTKELWDVWVDFVGFMYHKIVEGGRGLYSDADPALNPNDPKYADMKDFINKMKITSAGKKVDGSVVPVATITGHPSGGGAGMTHTIAAKHPYDALKQFDAMGRGEAGEGWAKAIKREVDPKTGLPFNKIMHATPAMTRYFGKALQGGQVDQDAVKRIIQGRIAGHSNVLMGRREAELTQQLNHMMASNRLFPKYTQKDIIAVKKELAGLKKQGYSDEGGYEF